jgi:hypothetical protein
MPVPSATDKGYRAEQLIIRAYLRFRDAHGELTPHIGVMYAYEKIGQMCKPRYKRSRVGQVLRAYFRGTIKIDNCFEE